MLLRRPCCFSRKLFADLEVAIAPCGHEGHNASARQAGPHEKTKCSATTIGTIFSQVSRCPGQFAQKQQQQPQTHQGSEKPHGGRRLASCGLARVDVAVSKIPRIPFTCLLGKRSRSRSNAPTARWGTPTRSSTSTREDICGCAGHRRSTAEASRQKGRL